MPYKIDKVTGEMSEYIFDFGGIVALRNFTARTNGERLIIQSATNANFAILDALVSEVEIDGVVYDTPQAAQEALQRLVFNPVVPVIMTLAERLLLQGALQKGGYIGTASDLKTLIDGKSDILHTHAWGDITDKPTLFSGSYNDLTDKPAPVDVSHLLPKGTYTGTAQDLKTALDNILTILQSDDTELDQLQEIVNYIKQNKKILGQLGIPNIAGLVDALSGKAPLNHTHAWDDITGKPAFFSGSYNDLTNKPTNLATEQFVSEEIGKLKIGGRNLVLNSKQKRSSNGYMGQYWDFSEPMEVGGIYTFSCFVEGNTPLSCYFRDVAGQPRQNVSMLQEGYNQFFIKPDYAWTGICIFQEVGLGGTGTASFEKIKLEKGNIATDWSPAPEDLQSQIALAETNAKTHATNAVNNLQVGGRNLLLKSNEIHSNSNYNLCHYVITEDIQVGEEITLSYEGELAPNGILVLFNGSGDGNRGSIMLKPNEKQRTIKWTNNNDEKITKGTAMYVYIQNVPRVRAVNNYASTIKKIKLEKGNKATDWTPAPEDIFGEINTSLLKTENNINTSDNINGYSQNGRTVVSTGTNNVIVTINSSDGFCASYQKGGTGDIIFMAGTGWTMTKVDGTNVINGERGSTATITIIGTEILLRVSNA